ncbi:MAG: hypothetical protein JSS27_03100 [Planctomycetes bacterium]|nr:hypothetical protein [Planctomycetota bacterium]
MAAPAQGDIYTRWLGVTETARPLNHYQLLRLKQFEDDSGLIRTHYNKLSANVRKYLATEYADRAGGLLNELTRAMLCLTDTRRKSDYDSSLGRTGGGAGAKRTFEEILVLRKLIDAEKLTKAQQLATAIGMELRDAILQQKVASPEQVVQAQAEALGVPYLDLAHVTLDVGLAQKMPATLARQHSCVPVMSDDERVMVASPNPLSSDLEDELRLRLGLPVRPVLCTPTAIHDVINKYYPREAAAREMGQTVNREREAEEQYDPVERAKARKNAATMAFLCGALGFYALTFVIQSLSDLDFFLQIGVALVIGGAAGGIAWLVKRR